MKKRNAHKNSILRTFLTCLLFSLIIFSCRKETNIVENQHEEIIFTLEKTSYFPFENIQIQHNSTKILENITINIGDSSYSAVSISDDRFLLVCPELLAGSYPLSFSGNFIGKIDILKNDFETNNPEELILNWCDSLTVYFNASDDKSYNQTAQDLTQFITETLKELNQNEKQQLAQLLFRQGLLKSESFKPFDFDVPDSFLFKTKGFDEDKWFASFSTQFTMNKVLCISSFAAAAVFFKVPLPIPHTKAAGVIAAAAGLYYLKKSLDEVKQLGNVIAKVGELEMNNKKTQSIDLMNDMPTIINYFKATLNNLTPADEAKNIYPLFFKDLSELNRERANFLNAFEKVRSWFTGGITSIDPSPIQLDDILYNRKLVLVSDRYSITSVSNKNIVLNIIPSSQGLELTASSNSLTEDTEFSFDITYNQPTLNHSITKSIDAVLVLKPKKIKMEYVSGNWQAGIEGQALYEKCKVRITDQDGQPIAGIAVNWKIISQHQGTVPSFSTSDNMGIAEASWIIEEKCDAKDQELEAKIENQSGYLVLPNQNRTVFRARLGLIGLRIQPGDYIAGTENGTISITTQSGFNQTFYFDTNPPEGFNTRTINYPILLPSLDSPIAATISYFGNSPISTITLSSECQAFRMGAKGTIGGWILYPINASNTQDYQETVEFEISKR